MRSLNESPKKDAVLNVRVPLTLKRLIADFIAVDTHMNLADFFRDACREKIFRDAPELYRKIFQSPQKEREK